MLQIQCWILFISLYVGTVYFQNEVSRGRAHTGLRRKGSLFSNDFVFHLRLYFILKDNINLIACYILCFILGLHFQLLDSGL